MKKIFHSVLMFIVGVSLVACQSSAIQQVTVTLPPPIPTSTLHPQFAAMQEQIAASGERFALNSDGSISERTEEGSQTIPGLHVAPDGTMTLIVNGETVTIDPSDVSLDDEKGINIEGYKLVDFDENDDLPAEWQVLVETVTIGGVTLTLDENGVVTKMEATGASDEIKADNMEKIDPANYGMPDADIVKDESGIHVVQDGENVAKWVGTEWEWDWEVMEGLEGGNPLFNGFAKTYPTTDSGVVRQTNEVQEVAKEIRAFAEQEGIRTVASSKNNGNIPIYLYDGANRTEAMIARVLTLSKVLDPNTMTSGVVDGWVCFATTSGELVTMKFNDIEAFIRRFN